MNCPQSEQYKNAVNLDGGLESLESEALGDIQTSFRCAVEYGVPASELKDIRYRVSNIDPTLLLVRNPRTGVGQFIEGGKRVYILNHDEWIGNPKLTSGPTTIGRYLYYPAVILLHSNYQGPITWCRNVLMHETLHSVSLYSRIWQNPSDIVSKHVMLIEGITECLTGYILYKRHYDCYNTWKSSIQGKCAIAYKPSTRLFCSLAQTIGIESLASFYLSRGSEFNISWSQFLETVRSLGFTKFNYALSGKTAFRESIFREECVKSITGFKKTYDSETKALDFSRIQ